MWRTDSLEKTLMLGETEGRRRRGRQRMRWFDGITDLMNMSLSKFREMGSLACCSPWGCKESDTSEWLNKLHSLDAPSPWSQTVVRGQAFTPEHQGKSSQARRLFGLQTIQRCCRPSSAMLPTVEGMNPSFLKGMLGRAARSLKCDGKRLQI